MKQTGTSWRGTDRLGFNDRCHGQSFAVHRSQTFSCIADSGTIDVGTACIRVYTVMSHISGCLSVVKGQVALARQIVTVRQTRPHRQQQYADPYQGELRQSAYTRYLTRGRKNDQARKYELRSA